MKYDLLKFIKHAFFQSPIRCQDCRWYHDTATSKRANDDIQTRELCLNPRLTQQLTDQGKPNTITIQVSRENRDLCGPNVKHFHIK